MYLGRRKCVTTDCLYFAIQCVIFYSSMLWCMPRTIFSLFVFILRFILLALYQNAFMRRVCVYACITTETYVFIFVVYLMCVVHYRYTVHWAYSCSRFLNLTTIFLSVCCVCAYVRVSIRQFCWFSSFNSNTF